MEKFVALLVLLIGSPVVRTAVINIKTYYDTDLETSNLFHDQTNQLCDKLGEFYEEKNDVLTLPKCIRFKSSKTLYCHGEMQNFRNYTNKPKLERIENLIICYHNSSEFDADLLKYFARLKNLFIGYSSFNHFKGKLPHLENLKFINITRNELESIKADFFSMLPSIRVIDLRYNQLHVVEKLTFDTDDSVRLYLFGNLWNCSQSKVIKWIAINDSRYYIADRKKLNCSDIKFRARPLFSVINYKMQLMKACKEDLSDLKNCSCHLSFLRYDEETHHFKPVTSVNCSSKGFYNFPQRLPTFTSTLFMDHNYISSLDALCVKNSSYNDVHDIYLEKNLIKDVAVLDNCEWFENFRVLSLKGNLLERIPVFAFINSFEKSHHALKLYLSGNRWLCTCRFQPRLLKLCQKYDLIIDKRKIQCNNEKNDPEIDGKYIMELSKTDVCEIKGILLNKYEIMSIIFAILIVILMVNLLYDYYRYRNHGKLPWLVMNTPLF